MAAQRADHGYQDGPETRSRPTSTTTKDFERVVSLLSRAEAAAKHLTEPGGLAKKRSPGLLRFRCAFLLQVGT